MRIGLRDGELSIRLEAIKDKWTRTIQMELSQRHDHLAL